MINFPRISSYFCRYSLVTLDANNSIKKYFGRAAVGIYAVILKGFNNNLFWD